MRRLLRQWPVLLPVLLCVILLLPYQNIQPVWDSQVYWRCIVEAALPPLHFREFFCANHIAVVPTLIYAFPQLFDPGNVHVLHATTIILISLSVVGFYACVRTLLPLRMWEAVMATCLYASLPALLANAVHFTLDTVLIAAFVPFLACLLRRNMLGVAFFGSLLALSKEPGAVAFLLAILLHIAARLWTNPKDRRISLLQEYVPALIPIGLFLGIIVMKHAFLPDQLLLYQDETQPNLLWFIQIFLTTWTVQRLWLMVLGVACLNFLWVSAVMMVAALWRPTVRGRKRKPLSTHAQASVLFLVSLFVSVMVVLAPYYRFNNIRYLLPLYAIFLLLTLTAVVSLFRGWKSRTCVLAVLIALNLVSLTSTVDPVSRFAFGTFAFGQHRMLAMGTEDFFCGSGRDPLVYNFEFTRIWTLQNALLEKIRPVPSTVFVTHPCAWRGFKKSMQFPIGWRAFHPTYAMPAEALSAQNRPLEVWFIEYPNFDNAPELAAMEKVYEHQERVRVEEDGYALEAVRLTLRSDR